MEELLWKIQANDEQRERQVGVLGGGGKNFRLLRAYTIATSFKRRFPWQLAWELG